jgi:hypothetical protein
MAKFYPELNESLQQFIQAQQLFFTATAADQGHINLSPKGIDTFRCVDHKTVAYLDLTGSGNETAAHLNQNGRMTMMFCSFSEQPLILRLYGQGRAIQPRHSEWTDFYPLFDPTPGERQIIVLAVEMAQTSCGTGVPIYDLRQPRSALITWAENKGKAGLQQYWQDKNQTSIDGLSTKLLED